jgi:2,3-bisphosphoglycerate-dependent phosphoglycerate mutase
MKIFLIRHAETDWNVSKVIQGQLNVDINKRGLEQCGICKGQVRRRQYDSIYTSDLLRAVHTATVVFGPNADIVRLSELNERCFGEYEGRPEQEFFAVLQKLEHTPDALLQFRPLNGESMFDMIERAQRAFKQIIEKHKDTDTIAILTHGGPIRAILMHVLNLSYSEVRTKFCLPNCSIYEVVLGKAENKVISHHIPTGISYLKDIA